MMWLLGILFVLCVGGVASEVSDGSGALSNSDTRDDQYSQSIILSGKQLKRILDAPTDIEACTTQYKEFLEFVDVTIAFSSDSDTLEIHTNLYCKTVRGSREVAITILTLEVDENGEPQEVYFEKKKDLETKDVSYYMNEDGKFADGHLFKIVGGFEHPEKIPMAISDRESIVWEACEKSYLEEIVAKMVLYFIEDLPGVAIDVKRYIVVGMQSPGPVIFSCTSSEMGCKFNNNARSVHSLTRTQVSDNTKVSLTSIDSNYYRIYKEPSFNHVRSKIYVPLITLREEFQEFWTGEKEDRESGTTQELALSASTTAVGLDGDTIINIAIANGVIQNPQDHNETYLPVPENLVNNYFEPYTGKIYFNDDTFYTDTFEPIEEDTVGVMVQKEERAIPHDVQYARLTTIEALLKSQYRFIIERLEPEDDIVRICLIYRKKFGLQMFFSRNWSAFWTQDFHALTLDPRKGFSTALKEYYPTAFFPAPSFKGNFVWFDFPQNRWKAGHLVHALLLNKYLGGHSRNDENNSEDSSDEITVGDPEVGWKIKLYC